MIGLLAEPAIVAAAGTIFGGVGLKVLSHVLSDNDNETTPAIDTTRDIWEQMVKTDEYACSQWTARWLEQKLVDAKVMTVADMTVCDMPGCLSCAPTHVAIKDKSRIETEMRRQESLAKANKARQDMFSDGGKIRPGRSLQSYSRGGVKWSGSYDEKPVTKPHHDTTYYECDNCMNVIPDGCICAMCDKPDIHAHEKYYHEKPVSRITKLPFGSGELTITRPSGVPERATPYVRYRRGGELLEAVWEWKDGTGYSEYRQTLETEEIEIQDGGGGVVSRIVSVYDPQSGEHLGDVNVSNRWDASYIKKDELRRKVKGDLNYEDVLGHFQKALNSSGAVVPILVGATTPNEQRQAAVDFKKNLEDLKSLQETKFSDLFNNGVI